MNKFALFLLPLVLAGCVQTKFTTPAGYSFVTTRFLWNGQIQSAEVHADGSARVIGYTSQQAELAAAVAQGVAQGLKP